MKKIYINSTLSVSMSAAASNTGSRPKTHSSKNRISLDGCSEGDVVAIVWNPDHGQYIIVQVRKYFYLKVNLNLILCHVLIAIYLLSGDIYKFFFLLICYIEFTNSILFA